MPRKTPGERLHAAIEDMADRAAERAQPSWGVWLDAPIGKFFVRRGNQEVQLMRVLVADRYEFRTLDTNDPQVTCVVPEVELQAFGVVEQFMEGLMGVLRANGCHGRYRKAGEEKFYEF